MRKPVNLTRAQQRSIFDRCEEPTSEWPHRRTDMLLVFWCAAVSVALVTLMVWLATMAP